ncbi:MAG: PorT family protein [Flavobacteriales bacterium]|nr:PorT family protein [Flavobacteriales bacterium]
MTPRSLSIVLAALLCSALANAQQSGIGVLGGAMASTTRSEARQYNIVPGGLAGLYFPLGLGTRFELQPELTAAFMGSSHQVQGSEFRVVDRSMYLQLPIMVKFFLTNAVNLQIGPQAGMLIGSWMSYEGEQTETTDDRNPYDFGVSMGLGVDFRSGIDLGVRYYNGLSAVLAQDDELYPRNRSAQLTVGYRFLQFKKSYAKRRG